MNPAVPILMLAACSPIATIPDHPVREHEHVPLARFMRETVNVPFSFALMEHDQPRRVHTAAIALQEAAQGLVHWTNPPTGDGVEARDVFYAYARDLEHHVGLLEIAARDRDTEDTTYHLRGIRQTCNSCHKFFRPANAISHDVAFDHVTIDFGGEP
jgi:hypothetical protein